MNLFGNRALRDPEPYRRLEAVEAEQNVSRLGRVLIRDEDPHVIRATVQRLCAVMSHADEGKILKRCMRERSGRKMTWIRDVFVMAQFVAEFGGDVHLASRLKYVSGEVLEKFSERFTSSAILQDAFAAELPRLDEEQLWRLITRGSPRVRELGLPLLASKWHPRAHAHSEIYDYICDLGSDEAKTCHRAMDRLVEIGAPAVYYLFEPLEDMYEPELFRDIVPDFDIPLARRIGAVQVLRRMSLGGTYISGAREKLRSLVEYLREPWKGLWRPESLRLSADDQTRLLREATEAFELLPSGLCSVCDSSFVSSDDGFLIGSGEVVAEQINRRPTFCEACQKGYCLGCAFDASKSRGLNYHCCPGCGAAVPDDWVEPPRIVGHHPEMDNPFE